MLEEIVVVIKEMGGREREMGQMSYSLPRPQILTFMSGLLGWTFKCSSPKLQVTVKTNSESYITIIPYDQQYLIAISRR